MEYALVFILTVLTIIFWSGKGSWLIAGYNTMDDKEKQNRGRCEMAFKKICFLYCVDGNGCYNRQYCFRERGSGKNTEEVWEPPVIMESMEEVKEEEPTEYSHIEFFSDQQRKDVVKQLGEQGLVSVTDDMNMENYQKMEDFYSAYISGMDAMVTVFNVQMEGNIGALTFVHRNGKIQSYYVTVG